jgi:Fe-S-cluster containining protein
MGAMIDPTTFPFTFNNEACSTCRGTCCRWGGYVWITEEEMIQIAAFRGMELGVFADTYLRAAYGKLSLQDRLIDGECVCCMFDPYENKCTIYEHRPSQCRTFPFWKGYQDNYQDLLEYCPGIVLTD